MAENKYRGIPVEIGEKLFILRYDFNALVALEDALGTPEVDFAKLGFKGQRALVWAGLQHNKKTAPTLAKLGDLLTPLIKDAKTYGAILEAAAKAYGLAFPEVPKEVEDDSKNAPATPGVGT